MAQEVIVIFGHNGEIYASKRLFVDIGCLEIGQYMAVLYEGQSMVPSLI